jgi:hypothetical protein
MSRIGWVVLALGWAAGPVWAEDITLTTYYPAPRAVYRELRTTNNTYLAQAAGAALVGSRVLPSGNAGKLLVVGTGQNPVSGVCPVGTAFHDENGTGGAPETGECRPIGLTVGTAGRVFLGRLAGAGGAGGRLHVVGLPPTSGTSDGGIVLQRSSAPQRIGYELWRESGAVFPDVGALGLAGTAGQWSLGSAVDDVILRAGGNQALHLATNPAADPADPNYQTRLYVSSTGRVGINTVGPQVSLRVADPNLALTGDGGGSIIAAGPIALGGLASDTAANNALLPSTPPNGAIYYRTADHTFRGRRNGVWGPLAGAPPLTCRGVDTLVNVKGLYSISCASTESVAGPTGFAHCNNGAAISRSVIYTGARPSGYQADCPGNEDHWLYIGIVCCR